MAMVVPVKLHANQIKFIEMVPFVWMKLVASGGTADADRPSSRLGCLQALIWASFVMKE